MIRWLLSLLRLGAPASLLARVSGWWIGYCLREFAWQLVVAAALLLAALIVLGATSGVGLVVTVVVATLLVVEIRFGVQSLAGARAIEAELAELPGEVAETRFPKSHLVIPPLMLFARSVVRRRGVVYHREGKLRLRLDVYAPRGEPSRLRPAVIQVHGGGWIVGSRYEQGIPLLNHLAANGWVGFNIDYRLSPRSTMPTHVIDVKRAIAWVRENAAEWNVDPDLICITGGSAGGHLAALAALTAGDPALQPGFENADTSVAAAVPFYGVYDFTDPEGIYYPDFREWILERIVFQRTLEEARDDYAAASPTHRIHPGAPPFLIFHGDCDSLVPVEDARSFAAALERVSEQQVLYVELAGSEHAFDLFPSLRTARVVEGIERFLRTVVEQRAAAKGGADPLPDD